MQRQSNIELLRCISMFMVILLHSSFLAFGMPEMEDIQTNPLLWGGENIATGYKYCGSRCVRANLWLVWNKT